MAKILEQRFNNGEELTYHELQEAYKQITGHKLASGANAAATARRLTEKYPERFEFEINRVRGFAWDMEDF